MLTIQMKNGNVVTYCGESYTDYTWKPQAFVVIRDKQWIGVYNLECVESVTYSEDEG